MLCNFVKINWTRFMVCNYDDQLIFSDDFSSKFISEFLYSALKASPLKRQCDKLRVEYFMLSTQLGLL